ncbi:MAG: 2-keto-4-pentenoate hydratase [Hyphomicrobiaceae bacterium]
MPNDRLDAIAKRLAEARRQGARIALEDAPRDYDEGFAVQDRVVAMLGEPVVGWKVIEVPNGPVVFAPLLAGGLLPVNQTWRVAGEEPAGIELEIAYRMGRDVTGDATQSQLLDAVASAHVVFELCQSRISDPANVPRHIGIADCISNSGIVVGSQISGWRDKDLKAIPGRLYVDDKVRIEGKSVDPVRALTVLAPALAAHGKALKAGHVVITGSLIGMNWLTGHHTIRGEIDGCGDVAGAVAAH